jgi:hypothetical protein
MLLPFCFVSNAQWIFSLFVWHILICPRITGMHVGVVGSI